MLYLNGNYFLLFDIINKGWLCILLKMQKVQDKRSSENEKWRDEYGEFTDCARRRANGGHECVALWRHRAGPQQRPRRKGACSDRRHGGGFKRVLSGPARVSAEPDPETSDDTRVVHRNLALCPEAGALRKDGGDLRKAQDPLCFDERRQRNDGYLRKAACSLQGKGDFRRRRAKDDR